MYKSPIEIIQGEMNSQLEDDIVRVVQGFDINVDKEELIRALNYDRQQYEKGYADGKADEEGWIPCSKMMPVERDAGILKKLGTNKRSDYVNVTIEVNGHRFTDTACTYDGVWNWKSRFAFPEYKVIAWCPWPEPYMQEDDKDDNG